MKNPKSRFLDTSMRAHTQGMHVHPMCMCMHATSMRVQAFTRIHTQKCRPRNNKE